MNKTISRIFITLFAFAMFITLSTKAAYATSFIFQGDGTSENPFQISLPNDFVLLAEKVNEGDIIYSKANYILTNDVDLSLNGNHVPIGFGVNYSFGGFFDGGGHNIESLTLQFMNPDSSTKYYGLFGYNTGTIQNLNLSGKMDFSGTSGIYAGSFVGFNKGMMKNLHSSMNIHGYINGGIAASNQGTISNSSNSGNISGWYFSGGITGVNRGVVEKTINSGTISGYNAGGIASSNDSNISSSINLGNIIGTNHSGGIASENGNGYNKSIITDTVNLGSIAGNTVGGLASINGEYGQILTSYSIGNFNGVTKGALIGNNLGIINHLYYSSFFPKGIALGGGTVDKLSNTELFTASSFIGFNFDSSWTINQGAANIPIPIGIGNISLSSSPKFKSGLGTVFSPFIIDDEYGLDEIRNFSGSFFELGNHIEFSNEDFNSSGDFFNDGSLWEPIPKFFGYLDGKGFSIINIKIQGNETISEYGLFGNLYGTVCNLELKGIDYQTGILTGTAGALAGSTKYGNIFHVNTEGKIANFSNIGGITGHLEGTLQGAISHVNITTLRGTAAGIAGDVTNSTLDMTINYGDITGATTGGIAYRANLSTLSRAFNAGNITSNGKLNILSGGIVGLFYNSTITDAFNIGHVVSNDLNSKAGGIIGISGAGTIKNCYNLGEINAGGIIGGIIGINDYSGGPTISTSYYLDAFNPDYPMRTDAGVALPIESFKNPLNFNGFNLDTIWEMNENTNYPFLSLRGMNVDVLTVEFVIPGTTSKAYPVFVDLGDKINVPFYTNQSKYLIKRWYKGSTENEWNFEEDNVTEAMTLTGDWVYQNGHQVLAGANRYATAVEISKASYDNADTAVLVQANNFPDALAAAPLAYVKNAPILLTNTDTLSPTTRAELERLGVKEVILMGGTVAISQNVEDILTQQGYSVSRIYGENRYKTAYEAAKVLNTEKPNSGKAVLASGVSFADALAAGSYAARESIPILLTSTNVISSSTVAALHELNITEVIVIGGFSAISENVESTLHDMGIKTIRIAGSNRVETSIMLSKTYFTESQSALIANGWVFADALAAAPFAAKNNMPIILSRSNSLSTASNEYLTAMKPKRFYVVGGSSAIEYYVNFQLDLILYQ